MEFSHVVEKWDPFPDEEEEEEIQRARMDDGCDWRSHPIVNRGKTWAGNGWETILGVQGRAGRSGQRSRYTLESCPSLWLELGHLLWKVSPRHDRLCNTTGWVEKETPRGPRKYPCGCLLAGGLWGDFFPPSVWKAVRISISFLNERPLSLLLR